MFIKSKKDKIKSILTVFIIFIFIYFGFRLFSFQPEAKKDQPSKISSLIKIELLSKTQKIPPPVLRNIFSPQLPSSSASLASSGKPEPIGGPMEISSKEGKEEGANQSHYFLSLRYIGYVYSSKKTIALVIVEGLTMAVEEGEYVWPEFKVIKITPEEIVIAGPDKGEIRFSLEGEKDEKI